MTSERKNLNNPLVKTNSGQIQKNTDSPAVAIIRNTAKLGESIKTAYSNEVTKSIVLRTEYEIWSEFDESIK